MSPSKWLSKLWTRLYIIRRVRGAEELSGVPLSRACMPASEIQCDIKFASVIGRDEVLTIREPLDTTSKNRRKVLRPGTN